MCACTYHGGMTSFSLVGRFQHFKVTYCLHLQGRREQCWESGRLCRSRGKGNKPWMTGELAHFLTRCDHTPMPWKQKYVHILTSMQPTKKDGTSCTISDLYSGDSLNLSATVTILIKAVCRNFSDFLQPNAWIILKTGSQAFPPFSFQQLFTTHPTIQCCSLLTSLLFKSQIYVGKHPTEDGNYCCILQNNLAQYVTLLICILVALGLNPSNCLDLDYMQSRQMPG
jgi:hypothetical protein